MTTLSHPDSGSTPISDGMAERIDALWNALADYDAARHDEALDYLLATLAGMLDARNASWIGAVRLPDLIPGDPIHGWRARLVRFLHPSELLDASIKEQNSRIDRQAVDICIIRNVALAGQLRANRLVDLVPHEWFAQDYYRIFYQGFGNTDAIYAGCPVNADAEVYFGLLRGPDRPPFNRADCDLLVATLRGLKWFHRQYMLSHGLLVASAPLTPVEREVLQGLLAGQTEKEIALAQERSLYTIHEHIKALYRKFGVKNRHSLMALWLGKMA